MYYLFVINMPPIYPNSISRIQTVKEERRVLRDVFNMSKV